MSKTVQIRNLDDAAYTVLRTRAASEGLSLNAYLKREVEKMAASPSMGEWLARATDRDWGVDRQTALRTVREVREDDER